MPKSDYARLVDLLNNEYGPSYKGGEPPYDPVAASDVCRRKSGGNKESDAAYLLPGKREMRLKVEGWFLAQGLAGAIPERCAEAFGYKDKNHTSPRISELLRESILVRTHRTAKTRSGASARVLVHRDFALREWTDERSKPFTCDDPTEP
jgi:hypothetical protein